MSEIAFIDHLKDIARRDDRGVLAALRRGLTGPPDGAEGVYQQVARFLPADGPWTWRCQCHYIVATLFAMHPESAADGSLGLTFRQVAAASGGDSIEKRFMALLKCHRDDLFDHLRQAVSLARSKDVPVCWEQLFSDILHWDDDRGYVQRNWSRSFWSAGTRGASESSESTSTTGATQ